MNFLVSFIANTYAYLAVVPFIPFFVVWIFSYLIYKDKKRASGFAIDVATLLLLGCVSAMCQLLFHSTLLFWLIILLLLVSGGLIGSTQTRLKGKIDYRKIYLLLSRAGFLLLSFLYGILFIYGLIIYI